MSNRDPVQPHDRQDAEPLGEQQSPHGNVQQWLEHNLNDEERGPVSHVAHDTDHGHDAPPGQESRSSREGSLVQVPIGATFGMDHDPSPQEREELVRFAAAADAELRGHGETTDGDVEVEPAPPTDRRNDTAQ